MVKAHKEFCVCVKKSLTHWKGLGKGGQHNGGHAHVLVVFTFANARGSPRTFFFFFFFEGGRRLSQPDLE